MVSQILQLLLCIGFHGLGLLARFVANNFCLSFYFSFRCVHALSQLLLQFPVVSSKNPGFRYLYIVLVMLTLVVLTFKLPYIYDYITKLYRQQAGVMQNHGNANVRNIGQG
jgi:hypothetical protein